MFRRVQASARVFGCSSRGWVFLPVVAVLASGCASKGFDLDSVAVDASLVTSSTGTGRTESADSERSSDEISIRNAVSSANLEELGDGRLHWANPETGSRGEISAIVEYRDEGMLCRRFSVSRESFRGVALLSADICLTPGGNWWTRTFEGA